ncbi:hypothetical protein O4328_42955 [Rhodococcus opacus]|uniref:DUF7064 domain-containing protein n=1 Tax=Rhodococcus opacus TaxID=37919 RepID=A0AAX3YTY1_RHOOP|nr:hypothetical protein [Rhodococcus opacus]MCZ4590303.1 hypothetical protein [Rhodococcus opacus]WLF51589.1 hypothetical protein Q5707_39410 [Rhodococcus opacus]WLF52614.1 hypothetical protein Q5707_45585 [Rhodococcus opacus]
MITPEDMQFHHRPDSHWQWVETLALTFHIPDTTINGIVYIVARPMLGVCIADVSLHDRITDLWEEQLYIDNQQHLPCPDSFTDFSLPNGLNVRALEPLKGYHVTYKGVDDTQLDLTFRNLHTPFDINDPKMDPKASERTGSGGDWSGHYEATYRITGEIIVRGEKYDVDCVDTGDRSWGPRTEGELKNVVWWHASFGEDLTIHLFTGHDIAKTRSLGPHVSGYVFEDGEIFGIVDSSGIQEYHRATPMGGEIEVTDVRGKKFSVTYSTLNACYWAPYPSNTYVQAFLRANHNGQRGCGTVQIGLSRAYLTRNRDAIRSRY